MKHQYTQKEFFRSFFRRGHLLFAAALLLDLVNRVFNLFASWLLGAVTDCMTTGDMDGLIRCAMVTAVGVPLAGALVWLGRRARAGFYRRAMTQYKTLAYSAVSAKAISAFSRENTGRYLSALTNDISSIERQYLPSILQLVEQVCGFVMALVMMLYYSPLLTLILVGACLLPLAVSLVMGGKFARLEEDVSREQEHFTGRIKDLLSGFAVIKSFKAERETEQLFADASNAVEQRKETQRRFSGLMDSVGTVAYTIVQLGVFIVGAFMALDGQITAGTVLVFVNLCNSILGPIQVIPGCWAGIKASRALVRKLAALTRENASRSGETMEPVLRQAITMENVSFGYEENKPVLKDVSLRLERGKKYAIVGASGSGKSTLLHLLMGGDDRYEGTIRLDDRDLRTVDPDSLYDLMSLIGQNVFLFDTTIRENITMFRQFPDEAVDSAVCRAGLVPVMAAKGESYRCGENGVGLSGGEKQRVSIARSLLRGTPVLMLDEATAALDNQTAFEVTGAILALEGLTRIVVTHRLEERLLQQYDEIIVLRDGRIIEQGTCDELMARTGYFYSLYHVTN